MNKWDEIRTKYAEFRPGVHPNSLGINWLTVMSPAEKIVWGDIRSLGLPFYPQFPVSKYFLDFAEPVEKINIEVDGKSFHKDKEKDAKRDIELSELGWQVIRIEGRQTMKGHEHYEEECSRQHGKYYGGLMCEDHQKEYISDSSEGILRELKYKYYA